MIYFYQSSTKQINLIIQPWLEELSEEANAANTICFQLSVFGISTDDQHSCYIMGYNVLVALQDTRQY